MIASVFMLLGSCLYLLAEMIDRKAKVVVKRRANRISAASYRRAMRDFLRSGRYVTAREINEHVRDMRPIEQDGTINFRRYRRS